MLVGRREPTSFSLINVSKRGKHMIAWPGSLVILSPAYVIALELARHFCFGCSLNGTDYDITQDYDYYYTGLRGGKKFLRTW